MFFPFRKNGMSSFPLTNSIIFKMGTLHHQPVRNFQVNCYPQKHQRRLKAHQAWNQKVAQAQLLSKSSTGKSQTQVTFGCFLNCFFFLRIAWINWIYHQQYLEKVSRGIGWNHQPVMVESSFSLKSWTFYTHKGGWSLWKPVLCSATLALQGWHAHVW